MKTKSLTNVQIKDAELGIVTGVFATYNVIDRDGDVHRKGCFTEGASVVISAYGHKSWDGALPVGHGTIKSDGDAAVFEAQFLMNTINGRDTFETVKALSEQGLQEWSYSLYEVEAERGTFQNKNVRFINKVGLVKEVSPTLMGAGINTRTTDVKGVKQLSSTIARMLCDAGEARWRFSDFGYGYCYLDDFDVDDNTAVFCIIDYTTGDRVRSYVQVDFTRTDTSVLLGDVETEVEYTTLYLPKGSKFSEHFDFALRGVKQLAEMATERLTVRAAEGKSITEQTDAYDQILAELVPLKTAIDTATQSPTAEADDLLANELVRFEISQGETA